MGMYSKLTPEAMEAYRATVRQRGENAQRERAKRRERAWNTAERAAVLLKEKFGAVQVAVFGSLVHGHWFSPTSDIDLSAWGLKDEDYFVAVAKLQDLSPEFRIDLVSMERCKPSLREVIIKEGKLL